MNEKVRAFQITQNTTVSDICNPKSLLTLGATSSMVVACTTTLAALFTFPPIWIAMALSVLFSAVQICYFTDVPQKGLKFFYIFITALIIFNTSRGGNATLASAEQVVQKSDVSMRFELIPSAYAGINSLQYQEETNKPAPIFKPW